MAKQTINQGTAPTGAGGDTFRTGSAKLQANDDEIYNYLGDGTNLNKLGTAAFKNVGTQAGNVMGVGAFGLGSRMLTIPMPSDMSNSLGSGFYYYDVNSSAVSSWKNAATNIFAIRANFNGFPRGFEIGVIPYSNEFYMRSSSNIDTQPWNSPVLLRHSGNTTVDANGFLKSASPIVKVFADKIELNDEAQQQEIIFEKLGVGDYLIKGSTGFAQEGWYVETPKDANGNLLVAVVYEQLENGDISVKTYDYMLNRKGRIVADIETSLDIPENRWIDLRLQELPQPETEVTDDPEQ